MQPSLGSPGSGSLAFVLCGWAFFYGGYQASLLIVYKDVGRSEGGKGGKMRYNGCKGSRRVLPCAHDLRKTRDRLCCQFLITRILDVRHITLWGEPVMVYWSGWPKEGQSTGNKENKTEQHSSPEDFVHILFFCISLRGYSLNLVRKRLQHRAVL